MYAKLKEVIFKGIPAAPGFAAGPSFIYQDLTLDVPHREIENPKEELDRFEVALNEARIKLASIKENAEHIAGKDAAAIFDAHALFLEDPALLKQVTDIVNNHLINIESSWAEAIEKYAKRMESLEDETFRTRAMDIRDVGKLVLRLLLGIEEFDLSPLTVPSVILADELSPSATANIDKNLALSFCTSKGGPTSHSAILARALGIPAIVGLEPSILEINDGSELLVDGDLGRMVLNPTSSTRKVFLERREKRDAFTQSIFLQAIEHAFTPDGQRLEVVANVGNIEDARDAVRFGAEGIGLLRTEFLYLYRQTAPNEDEQLIAYKSILDVMGKLPVVVRTLDVGGDKELPYLNLGKEANPFLGLRAIRISLDQPAFFKIQLRALLRASFGHELRIMFPMIARLEELRDAKNLLQEAREEVLSSGHSIANEIQVGIMVEIPSVVQMADQFAQEVDFFSIGTNDLTQYTMAADRTNAGVAHLNDALYPAVLRQINTVIDAGHNVGIWVGVCGELAGDTTAIPILIGLGVDELSMTPRSIPNAKAIIRRWPVVEAQKMALEVMDLDTARDVRNVVSSRSLF